MTHRQENHTKNQVETPSQHDDLESGNVDCVSSNVKSSQFGSMHFIVEDNEVVTKMIIKDRSPTMRHVSRPHRVALDWLLDRINLDPKIQSKYVDTKNQLADILTEGNFTRGEWINLLHIFNIGSFSSAGCPKSMATRMQKEKGQGRIVARSKPTLNLVSHTASSSSTAPSSSASSRPFFFFFFRPGSEFSRTWKESCSRKSRNHRRGRLEVAAQLPHIS